MLGNLVVKAVTAPFSLLASAFGGGDELSRIDFAAGRGHAGRRRAEAARDLGKALRERPGISFEIEGGADPEAGSRGAAPLPLRAQAEGEEARRAGAGRDAAVASVDDLQIDSAERPSLLEAAYEAETFSKPKNALGMDKSLPPPRWRSLMLGNTRVEDDELRALALRRATIVQSALAKAVPGGASRLFLVTPRLGGPGGHVEFKLKKD